MGKEFSFFNNSLRLQQLQWRAITQGYLAASPFAFLNHVAGQMPSKTPVHVVVEQNLQRFSRSLERVMHFIMPRDGPEKARMRGEGPKRISLSIL